jgi:hypothetical protein
MENDKNQLIGIENDLAQVYDAAKESIIVFTREFGFETLVSAFKEVS